MEYKKFEFEDELSNLKKGDILSGKVKNIKPYGVFVETTTGLTGLLYIEDISVSRIKTPYERFEIGQNIDIMVKSIDKNNNKVFFTHKELLGTWEENAKEIARGTVIKGIAREPERSKNGIFIEIKPNLVGLADYIEGIEYGQEVDVYVKSIIPEKKKIKLSIMKG